MTKRKFTVGQRVWMFDLNHRVYARDDSGRSTGGPIYEKHFVEKVVTGIEGRSYVLNWPGWDGKYAGHKIGFEKAHRNHFSDEEKNDKIWSEDHRYKIVSAVQRCDGAMLKKVADVIGYTPAATQGEGKA